jgi:hypothetical protein
MDQKIKIPTRRQKIPTTMCVTMLEDSKHMMKKATKNITSLTGKLAWRAIISIVNMLTTTSVMHMVSYTEWPIIRVQKLDGRISPSNHPVIVYFQIIMIEDNMNLYSLYLGPEYCDSGSVICEQAIVQAAYLQNWSLLTYNWQSVLETDGKA